LLLKILEYALRENDVGYVLNIPEFIQAVTFFIQLLDEPGKVGIFRTVQRKQPIGQVLHGRHALRE